MFLGPHHTWADGSRPGTGRRRLPQLPRRFFWTCPLRCDTTLDGDQCAIVRTQVRGITMRCTTCGVQFSVTWHQLARAHRRREALMGHAHRPGDLGERLEALAALVDERRGRRRAAEAG